MNILNRTNGKENVLLYSNEITGFVYIAELVLLRFITNDMQKRISEKNQSNGWFQFANLVMTPSIIDILKIPSFVIRFFHMVYSALVDNFARRSNALSRIFSADLRLGQRFVP